MSVGLYLKGELKPNLVTRFTGKLKSAEETLRQMDTWVRDYCKDLIPTTYIGKSGDQPTLFCRLHPAAEDVEISFTDAHHFTASSNTSSAGPGYHIFVCDMLYSLGEQFNAIWQEPTEGEYCDETGYFHSGDPERVFAEMATWLKGVANLFFDGTLADTDGPTRLAMPMDINLDWNSRAITPMGPRDTEWLKRSAEDGHKGRDFFAWWTPGLNAEYFMRRALARMWTEARWRKPINDRERKVLEYIADSLQTAYKLDPNLSYPWTEWAETLKLLEDDGQEHDFVRQRAAGTPTIGYRRRDVAVQLPGNWWITLPGSFSDFVTEGESFCAQDPPKAVWYRGYRFTGDTQQSFAHWRAEMRKMEKDLLQEKDDYTAAARIKLNVEDGQEYFALASSNVCSIGRCILTVIFARPEEKEWAIAVWKSLQPPQVDGKGS